MATNNKDDQGRASMVNANFDREAAQISENIAGDSGTNTAVVSPNGLSKVSTSRGSHKQTQSRSAAHFAGELQEKVGEARRRAWLHAKGVNPTVQHQLDLLFPNTINQSQRFILNDFARSAIFTARNRNEARATLMKASLFHLNTSIEVQFTGIELRAEDDELVWMQLMHYSKSVPLGDPIRLTIRQLVKDIGWSKNGTYYDKARECISRLKANEVLIKNNKAYGTSGSISLIQKYDAINDGEGKANDYVIWIDPKIVLLFAGNNFTNHTWDTFRRLSPVSRRLADYIESHQHPFELELDNFKQLCGSTSKTQFGWRRTVKKACEDMEREGIAKSCKLADNDKIYILR